MARTVAGFIAEALQKAGVKRVYGVVGDSLNAFTDSLRRLESIDRWLPATACRRARIAHRCARAQDSTSSAATRAASTRRSATGRAAPR
ncbi:MAG: hypothetical protein WBW74_08030 [Xanthobacteraceae bacterium]